MPKPLKTLQELQQEIESILDSVTSQRSPLKYLALRQIAKAQGWEEYPSCGKGDHRCFKMKGYATITVDCPGEGHELNAHVARLKLQEIYQPSIDNLINQFGQEALDQAIDKRIRKIVEQLDSFSDQATQILTRDKAIRAILEEEFKDAKHKIAVAISSLEEIQDEQTERCLRAANGLIKGEKERYNNKVEKLSIQLNESDRINQSLQKDIQVLEETITTGKQDADAKIKQIQLELTESQKDRDVLRGDLLQLERSEQGLREALADADQHYQRLSLEFKGLKRQQFRKDIAALIGLGLAIVLGVTGIRSLAIASQASDSATETVSLTQ